MTNIQDISAQFIEQLNQQISDNQKPNPGDIANYLVSLLPDSVSDLLEPIHPDGMLLSNAKELTGLFSDLNILNRATLGGSTFKQLNEVHYHASRELESIHRNSKTVGGALSGIIYGGEVDSVKAGEALSQIIRERINASSGKIIEPNKQITASVQPIIKEGVRNFKGLEGFSNFQKAANIFVNCQRGLSARQEATYSM